MMTTCEKCGVGDDMDMMFSATDKDGNSMMVCEGCSKDKSLSDVVPTKKVMEAIKPSFQPSLHILENDCLDSTSYDIVIVDSDEVSHPIARCWDYAFAEDILKTAKERYAKDCAVLTED